MALKNFERVSVTDPQINEIQYRLETVFRPITDSVIVDGTMIEDIELSSGVSTKIAHKLGRTVKGWIVIRKNAAQHVYDENSGQTDLDTYLHLKAGGNVTISIWVF